MSELRLQREWRDLGVEAREIGSDAGDVGAMRGDLVHDVADVRADVARVELVMRNRALDSRLVELCTARVDRRSGRGGSTRAKSAPTRRKSGF